MSNRLAIFLGVVLLHTLVVGQAANEVPVASVSTALPGSPSWSATAPFNTLVTRNIDPITGQLGLQYQEILRIIFLPLAVEEQINMLNLSAVTHIH